MLSAATTALLASVTYGCPDMLITWPSGPVAALKSCPAARITSAVAPVEYALPNRCRSGPGSTSSSANTGIEAARFQ